MAPRDGDDYDKPKKSWSEIDKARDGRRTGGSSSGTSSDRDRAKFESSTNYSRYKSAADKFFSGESTPDPLKEKLDPTGSTAARQAALRKLKDADDFRAFATVAKEYVAAHGLPEDVYLLDRLLGHPDEALVTTVLAELTRRAEAGELKPPKSLPERLKSLELGSDNPELQDGAKALAKKIRDLPR